MQKSRFGRYTPWEGRGNHSQGHDRPFHCRGRTRGGYGGPPRGLRGREIGLYYAKRNKEQQSRNRPLLSLNQDQRKRLLGQIQRVNTLDPFTADSSNHREFFSKYQSNLCANKKRSLCMKGLDQGSSSALDSPPNPGLAQELLHHFEEVQGSSGFKKMEDFRKKLPAYKMRHELVNLIKSNQVVVISGETGCGKTTQVPQFILDDALVNLTGDRCKIVCTQPRRISAITIAERVAEERGEQCSKAAAFSSVGYQIRLESKLPREQGSILYCTTGVVLQWMRTNPSLRGVSHIVLDEIHERDLMSDFLITILKDTLIKRSDLKVILMSATLNADQFSRYYNNCPKINIPGFTHPVKEFYLEDVLEATRFRFSSIAASRNKPEAKWHKYTKRGRDTDRQKRDFEGMIHPFIRDLESSGKYSQPTLESLANPASEDINHELIASLVQYIHINKGDGAVLVFLPGWEDISKVNKLLTEGGKFQLKGKFKVYPLHSLMPTVSQKEIFLKPSADTRKIVIATNIAETSITIDDVVYVVDCGKIKMTNFDVEANIATMKPEWVSLANARQRRGRAGRVQPGICFHLYSRAREMILDQFVVPEMLRTRLEEVILQIKVLELGNAQSFLSKVMEPPSEEALLLAVKMLKTINALDEKEQLTPLGFHLAHLPMDPQTGKMILLGAIFCCLDPVLSVAASLSFKDAFMIPLGKESEVDRKKVELSRNTMSDHLLLANVMSGWRDACRDGRNRQFCWDYFLSESTLKMLNNMKGQYAEHLASMKFLKSSDVRDRDANRNSGNEDLVRAVICAGLYPNVASIKMKKNFPLLRTETDRRVSIHPKSVNAKQDYFKHPWMVYHLKMKSSSVFVYDCSVVSPMSLIFFGKHLKAGEEILEDQTIIETISVDNFVKFNCARDTSILFRDLRNCLDQLLEYKVSNPGVTNWDDNTKEGVLLSTIISLLSINPRGSFVEEEND